VTDAYDVVVIGGGPGGYVAAIRAAQLGLKTACVEKRGSLGGTCLNIGCIPSKALLQSSEKYEEAKHALAVHGVKLEGVSLDLPAMMARKDKVVSENTRGVEFLFKKNKVEYVKGAARFVAANRLAITPIDGGTARELEAKSIIIATGSDVVALPGVEIDEKTIVSSTGALSLTAPSKRLLVIGAGVIGLELGSVWQRLGAELEVIEYLDRILPGLDGETAKQFQRLMQKRGTKFQLSSKVIKAQVTKGGVTVTVEPAAGGEATTMEADIVLVAIGRRPVTAGLGLAEVGVALDQRGRVEIDAHFATNVPGIYAIGDVVRGLMLAHKAEDEGIACAEIIAGKAGHVNYDVIPGVVYTTPEVSSVGKTEEELKQAGVPYNSGKFPFTANGRSKVNQTTDGFVKVLADAKTDRVLGVHIIGIEAGEMIHEAAVLMEFGGAAEDLARTCHAHPTRSEAIKEAALAVGKRAIHM